MNAPTFSICIPNYNYGRYIGDTIQSVLNQTYKDFEIIIVDNASTDNSLDIIKSFKDDRIKLIENRYNIGFAPNLQKATQCAQGKFINLLSSDDQMKPIALEVYAQIIAQCSEDEERLVIYSMAEGFDDDDRIGWYIQKAKDGFYLDYTKSYPVPPVNLNMIPYEVYEGREVLKDSLSRLKTYAPFLSLMYSRRLWEGVEGYNGVRTIGPDKHFGYKILTLNPKVIYIPLILYRYRDFPSSNRSAESTTIRQPIDDYLNTIEWGENVLQELGLSREQLIQTFLNNTCLKKGLSSLGHHNYRHAFQLWAFAISSYPGYALRMKRTYFLFTLLSLGPLAPIVASTMLKLYHRLQGA